MWDVEIHILGIMAECACREAGGSGTRPYGGLRDSPVLRRVRTPAAPTTLLQTRSVTIKKGQV